MADLTTNTYEEDRYSKFLSALFSFISLVVLSILCLLNNLSLDLYSSCMLLKIVVPATFCYWYLGKVMGRILDKNSNNKAGGIKAVKLTDDNEAYSIPSMFTSDAAQQENAEPEELGEL